MFAAITFVVIVFVAAIANAGEFRAASRTFNVVELCVFVDADGVAASRAFHFNEIIVTIAAIAIVVVAITAVAVVAVELFFESAKVFVDLFDIRIEVFSIFLESCDFLCDITENVEDRVYDLIVNGKSFSKAFDVCNFFRNVHGFDPSFLLIVNW